VAEGEEKEKAGRSRGGSNLLVILLLVVVLALGGVSFWLWKNKGAKAETEKAPEKPKVESVLKLEPFVLNLSDPEQKTYLRVGIELGLSKTSKKEKGEGAGEGGPPVALVRDTILGVLSVGKADELLTPEGKTKLKDDVLGALQKRAPELGAEEVYFTEFLIQR
jgi:flagellar FliL protein